MSQQAKPGRRTPLSLGQPKGDVSDKSQMRTSKATVNLEKLSTELLTKQAKNGSSEEKIDNNKAENGQNNATNNGSTTKKDGNGVHHSDISIDNSKTVETAKQPIDKVKLMDNVKDDKTASPKVAERPVEKAKPSNEKVAATNDKQKSLIDTAGGISKIEDKSDAKNSEKEVRESVRQKQIREEKEKEESVKVTPIIQPTNVAPSTPDKNPESLKVKEKRKPEAATPTKTPKTLPSDSLLAEKSLKGFNENLEEAESIRINDSPMPAKDSKLIKLSQAPPMSASRSQRSDKLDDASLVVNLSTVSELSNESTNNSTPVERSYSLRHITGRKSTRPLREISFDFRMRESYYKIQNEFSDSISNNVTSPSDSPRISGQLKRSIDDVEIESPKRSKFDNLFEFVSSPVKILGAKFARTKLSTSTPNKLIVSDEISSGIEAEKIQKFASEEETAATVELNAVDDAIENKMEIDIEIPTADEEAPIEVHEPSKSRCVLM